MPQLKSRIVEQIAKNAKNSTVREISERKSENFIAIILLNVLIPERRAFLLFQYFFLIFPVSRLRFSLPESAAESVAGHCRTQMRYLKNAARTKYLQRATPHS